MRTFVVRHGNTFAPGEPLRRIGARTDLPLVASGRTQATALAAHFTARGVRFERCLAGPLERTRETAALIAPDLPVETADWLREIDHGPDEGADEAAVLARIGHDGLATWEVQAVAPPGWIVDAAPRLAAWRDFFATARGDILLVTSNGAARFALLALGLAPAKLRTGAFGEIAAERGAARLIAWDVRPDRPVAR